MISRRKVYLFITCLIVLVCGFSGLICQGASRSKYIRYRKAYGKNYVYLQDVARYYGMQLISGLEGCELRSRYSRIIFTYDKRQATLNGIKINFLFAPFRSGSEPMMSEMDFTLVLDPILRYRALRKHRMQTIMIDPGHGGRDTGAIGSIYREKDIVLQISYRLRSYLQRRGYRVLMTRSGDQTLSLSQRTDACRRQNPDIFVSLHCNAARSISASGIETFCMTPANAPSTADSKPGTKREPGNSWDANNVRLAYTIQKSLIQQTGAIDRGVKHARFYVIRNVSCPAILLEMGFLSNYGDQIKLGRASYQEQLAAAIAEGIVLYHRELNR